MIPGRCDEAIKLYKRQKIDYILVSGGIGFLNKDRNICEATLMREYLEKNGVDSKKIIVENSSRNTYENAWYSINLLKEKFDLNKDYFILITSCYHMKRSYLLFKSICNINLDCACYKENFKLIKKLAINLKEELLIWYYKFKKVIKNNYL